MSDEQAAQAMCSRCWTATPLEVRIVGPLALARCADCWQEIDAERALPDSRGTMMNAPTPNRILWNERDGCIDEIVIHDATACVIGIGEDHPQ